MSRCLGLLALALLPSFVAADEKKASRPNVLFVFTDDHAAHDHAADDTDDDPRGVAPDRLRVDERPARRRNDAGGSRPGARRRSPESIQQGQSLIDHVEAGVRIVEGDVARRHDVDPVGGDERPHPVLLAERREASHGRGVDRGA